MEYKQIEDNVPDKIPPPLGRPSLSSHVRWGFCCIVSGESSCLAHSRIHTQGHRADAEDRLSPDEAEQRFPVSFVHLFKAVPPMPYACLHSI